MKYGTPAFWTKHEDDLSEADLWRKALHEPDEKLRGQYEKRLHALWETLGPQRAAHLKSQRPSRRRR